MPRIDDCAPKLADAINFRTHAPRPVHEVRRGARNPTPGVPAIETSVLITGFILFGTKVIISQIPAMWLLALNRGHVKRTWAFCFVDACLNLLVIAKAVTSVSENPIITVFYAAGFATGMVLGMKLSPHIDKLARKLAREGDNEPA